MALVFGPKSIAVLILNNVKGQFLTSQEWCDLVFEGRNKNYGAYVLRRDTGRRYRMVAMLIGSVFAVFLLFAGVAGFFVYQAAKERIAEIEDEVKKLKPLEEEKLKAVSAGRRAVKGVKKDKATQQAPEMVDNAVVVSLPIAIASPDDIETEDASELRDKDMQHNTDQRDLPIEGAQLIETEKVEEMPIFPGGIEALMRFMDANTVYSSAAISQRLEGDVEVAFIIDPEGNLIEPQIIKHVHPTLDNAVLTAVKRMPKWKPGKVNGKPGYVKVRIPVHFQVN